MHLHLWNQRREFGGVGSTLCRVAMNPHSSPPLRGREDAHEEGEEGGVMIFICVIYFALLLLGVLSGSEGFISVYL